MTAEVLMHRRDVLKLSVGALLLGGTHTLAVEKSAMRTRRAPRTGEELPVIGLGTWQTFDVGDAEAERAPLVEVLGRFFAAGGRVIDSSPMYGRSESVLGDLVTGGKHKPFLATKVWTRGLAQGKAQVAESMRRLRTEQLDLLQVHNLLDVKTHLPVMRAMRDAGKLRHVGITHYALSSFEEMERLLRTEKLDFVQLPYSVRVRDAERRLLPAAADTGTAVLVMRPFEEGALFARVKGRPLPAWATERGFGSWSQLFLAFILAHKAVTCVLPATAKPHHLDENIAAGKGPELDDASRAKLIAELA